MYWAIKREAGRFTARDLCGCYLAILQPKCYSLAVVGIWAIPACSLHRLRAAFRPQQIALFLVMACITVLKQTKYNKTTAMALMKSCLQCSGFQTQFIT